MPNEMYSVTRLNQEIKQLLEFHAPFRNIFVQGEISNYKAHPSGHHYFTLKDADAAISAVLFRSDAVRLRFRLQNGMKIIARGRISSFPKSGQVQFYVADCMPDGQGALHTAFEQIKRQLADEGLFAESHKKSIPLMPQKIGIITAESGAAVQDMLQILKRRWPIAQIFLYPALVQGAQASADLCRALHEAQAHAQAEVLIIGRGGGSLEDLWAFNEEKTARAIYDCTIPIISAVGHEPDITIADYVADLRAPTPSAAAEMVCPDTAEIQSILRSLEADLRNAMAIQIQEQVHAVSILESRLQKHAPQQIIADRRLWVDYMTQRLAAHAPTQLLQKQRLAVESLEHALSAAMQAYLADLGKQLGQKAAALSALSPLEVLSRGYAAVYDRHGKPVTQCGMLSPKQSIQVQFADGTAQCSVETIQKARTSIHGDSKKTKF